MGGGDPTLLLADWGGCPEGCPGDLDGDGMIGGADVTLLLASWGRDASTDRDCDGVTDAEALVDGAWTWTRTVPDACDPEVEAGTLPSGRTSTIGRPAPTTNR